MRIETGGGVAEWSWSLTRVVARKSSAVLQNQTFLSEDQLKAVFYLFYGAIALVVSSKYFIDIHSDWANMFCVVFSRHLNSLSLSLPPPKSTFLTQSRLPRSYQSNIEAACIACVFAGRICFVLFIALSPFHLASLSLTLPPPKSTVLLTSGFLDPTNPRWRLKHRPHPPYHPVNIYHSPAKNTPAIEAN